MWIVAGYLAVLAGVLGFGYQLARYRDAQSVDRRWDQ